MYSEFVGEEVDKVELVYSRFVSLISAEPSIQTLLPMSKEGEICDVNGKCIDAKEDIMFTLTSEDGKFAVTGSTGCLDCQVPPVRRCAVRQMRRGSVPGVDWNDKLRPLSVWQVPGQGGVPLVSRMCHNHVDGGCYWADGVRGGADCGADPESARRA